MSVLGLLYVAAAPDGGVPADAATGSTIVTATRAPAALRDVVATVTVIPREEIVSSPTLTQDMLVRTAPSAATFRRSSSLVADPTSQGVNLRGLGPSAVSRALVLADGVPLNDAFGGWVYWRAAPRLGLERIEIVPSGGSSLWGSGALGGVVQLVSRPITGTQVDAEASFGSFHTFNVAARAARRFGDLGAAVNVELLGSNGYTLVAPWDRGAIDATTPSLSGVADARVEYRPSRGAKLQAHVAAFRESQNGGTRFTSSSVDVAQVDVSGRFDVAAEGQLDVSLLARHSRFGQQRARVGMRRDTETLAAVQDVPSNEQGVSAVFTSRTFSMLGPHRVLAGLDARRVHGVSRETSLVAGTTRVTGGEQQFGGLFVQNQYDVLPWLQLTAGLRWDGWRDTGGRADDLTYPDRFSWALSPRAGFRLRALEWLTIRASGYRSFRAPTLNELYRPFQVGTVLTQANAALEPETLWGAEAGVAVEPWRFVSVSATAFVNDWRSPIVNVTLPGGGRQRQNLGSARVRGVELDARFRPVHWLWVRAGYTYVESAVTSAPNAPELAGKQLPQDPRHRAFAAVTYDDPRLLTATVQLRWVGPQFEDDLNTLPMAGYVVVDALLSRRVFWKLDAFLAVENLFDREYLVGRAGVDTLGAPFSIRGGLKLRWEAE